MDGWMEKKKVFGVTVTLCLYIRTFTIVDIYNIKYLYYMSKKGKHQFQ